VGFAYQVAFDRSFNVPRCHVCIDHQNFLAEICVGDAWLPSTVGTRTGISLVVCRTSFASDAMAILEARGDIRATRVSEVEIEESQTRRVTYGDFSYALAEYLRESGSHVPEMVGPNRPAARLWSRKKVARFQRENLRKLEHQRARRYRWLYWRKLLRESGPLALRYVRWLFVRILRIKSLLGIRDEIPREEIERFR
jgi:coenzyme F420-reducing hydrogenase beta subunit